MAKKWFLRFTFALTFMLLLAACGGDADGGEEGTSAQASANTIEIVATNWEFNEETFEVPAGEATIQFTAEEGAHAVSIPDLDVELQDGETKNVTLESGEYSFFCSIPCGEGHEDMKGTIVVK